MSWCRILVIEDEVLIANTLREALSEHDIEVHTALSGHAALQLASQNRYDVILVDLNLPDVAGLAVLEKLRRSGVDATAIVFAGVIDEADERRARNLGVEDFIKKPASMKYLVGRIHAVANRVRHLALRPDSSPALSLQPEEGQGRAT